MAGSRNAAAFRSACFSLNSYDDACRLADEYLKANT
jgi:hypothetical protein